MLSAHVRESAGLASVCAGPLCHLANRPCYRSSPLLVTVAKCMCRAALDRTGNYNPPSLPLLPVVACSCWVWTAFCMHPGAGVLSIQTCEKRGLFGSAPVSYRRTATARRGHLAANRLLARHGRHGASARNRRSLSTQRQESPCKRDWILVGRRRCEPAQGWRLATTAADTDPTPAKPLQPPCAPCGVDVAVAARHLPVAAAALAVAALTIVAVMPFSITHAGLHVAQQGRPALGVCPLAADGAPPSLTTGVPQPTRARACAGSPPRRSCEQRGAARAVCKRAEAATLGGDDRHVRQRCHQRRR